MLVNDRSGPIRDRAVSLETQPMTAVVLKADIRRAPTELLLEIEIPQRLPVVVADDEAGVVVLLDHPGRREAVRGGHGSMIARA